MAGEVGRWSGEGEVPALRGPTLLPLGRINGRLCLRWDVEAGVGVGGCGVVLRIAKNGVHVLYILYTEERVRGGCATPAKPRGC